ncbi:hypothetical protein DPMN_052879 [Dreissena polymorpha]|uniref:Uncharacterized protein n=1 Tax=Dreissena polymorpha TaxID=45954 RepID=A0A9D4HNC7_DREPO|nr:hypothetical protein DPMN_052879 [Dreissena polymorpha]
MAGTDYLTQAVGMLNRNNEYFKPINKTFLCAAIAIEGIRLTNTIYQWNSERSASEQPLSNAEFAKQVTQKIVEILCRAACSYVGYHIGVCGSQFGGLIGGLGGLAFGSGMSKLYN